MSKLYITHFGQPLDTYSSFPQGAPRLLWSLCWTRQVQPYTGCAFSPRWLVSLMLRLQLRKEVGETVALLVDTCQGLREALLQEVAEGVCQDDSEPQGCGNGCGGERSDEEEAEGQPTGPLSPSGTRVRGNSAGVQLACALHLVCSFFWAKQQRGLFLGSTAQSMLSVQQVLYSQSLGRTV